MKKQLLSRKKLSTLFYSLCLMLLFANTTKVQAQIAANGDYRSAVITGDWSDINSWQVRDVSGNWTTPSVVPSLSNNVYIQNGHTISVSAVTAANVNCKDLHINATTVTTAQGVLAITDVYNVNVYGKIRAYTGAAEVSAIDGTYLGTSTSLVLAGGITTPSTGVLKFVGSTRNITNTGEWGTSGLTNNTEFALDAGAVGMLVAGVKFKNVLIASGTVSTGSAIATGAGVSDIFRIGNGAKFTTSRNSTNGSIINGGSSAKCNLVQIDAGGTLEMSGAAPTLDATTFTNNGTVSYSGSAQTFLKNGTYGTVDAGSYNNYVNLSLGGTSAKTPLGAITVSTVLKFTGTATLAVTSSLPLTMLNGSTVERSVTSGTSLPSAAGAVFYGLLSTDLINVIIGSTISNSNEFPSAPTPGKLGTLTVNNGVTYTITGGRTVTNVVNNNIIALVPTTTLTLTINGNISGGGSITGSPSASISFGGTYDGNAGTLNFTSGSQFINNIVINRVGTNSSVTLGTAVTTSGIGTIVNGSALVTGASLTLTAGALIGSGNLTLGNGATITRSGGSLDASPIFGTSLTLNYTTSAAKIVGGEMPNSGAIATAVNISSSAVTLNTTKNISTLTLTSGSLTVSSGANLTIQNELTNNAAEVVIESGANLIQVNNIANTGAITVKRNGNALSRLDYTIWSSPLASQNLLLFSPATLATRFYNYNTGTNQYNAENSANNFATGTGYLIRMPDTAVTAPATEVFNGVFTGVPNNGDVPVTLSYVDAAHGYNMVGNPYPSTINAETFLVANSANIEGTLYFWRKTNGASGSAYATYTAGGATTTTPTSTAPNGTIQVGQGFFVQAKSAATVNTFFTNAMRTANTANQFFKTTNKVERNRVWLNLTNTTGVFSQMLVGYMADATQGVDTGIDGKYINDSQIALTSNINNEEYVIQGRALPFDSSDVVALNFKTDVDGDYTIAIDHADGLFADGQDVFLKDNATGAETDLKAGSYTFTAAAGTDNARFSLKYQKTLGINETVFNDNSVTVYKNKGTLYVNSDAVAIANIKVFDIQGRLIAEQKNVNSNTVTIKDLKVAQQVLIVKITGEDNKVVNKKVVN